jgi:integrase
MSTFYLDDHQVSDFLWMFRRPGSANWYYRFSFPGESGNRYVSTRKADLRQAKEIALAAYREAAILIAAGQRIARPTMAKLADEFYTWVDTLKCHEVQRNRHKSLTRRILLDLFGDRPVASLGAGDVQKYVDARAGKVKDSTINIELNTLRAWCNFGIAKGLRTEPLRFKALEIDPEDTENSWFDYYEYLRMRRLLQLEDPYMRDIVVLAFHLGARVSELKNLLHTDYHTVRINRVNFVRVLLQGKGKKRKRLYPPIVLKILTRLKELTQTQEVMPREIRKQFRDFLLVNGLRFDLDGNRRTLGNMRHSKATARMGRASTNRVALAAWMGHSPEMAAKIYYKFDKQFEDRELISGATDRNRKPSPPRRRFRVR